MSELAYVKTKNGQLLLLVGEEDLIKEVKENGKSRKEKKIY